jgi:hypothetical protein
MVALPGHDRNQKHILSAEATCVNTANQLGAEISSEESRKDQTLILTFIWPNQTKRAIVGEGQWPTRTEQHNVTCSL